MDRIEKAREFLRGLIDRETTDQLMKDRVGSEMLEVIKEEADRIASVQYQTKLTYDETIRACIFIGYLLRSHMERVDMCKNLPDED
jgi:hypothetical protein